MANVGSAPPGKTLIGSGNGASPTFKDIGTSCGLTAHGLVIAEGNSPFVATSVGSNGQVIIGATGADPAFATLTSSDSSISFTTGANSLSLQVAGGSTVGKTITGNSGGAISPTAGNWNILGTSTAAGSTPVTTSGSVSTLTVNVQKTQAIASTDATKVGLAAFDSADFTVDANGFVSATTTGFLKTLTGNSGGAISPVASNINTVGTGSITIVGSGSTLTTQLTGLTNHAVLVGAGTATITSVGPTATAGQVLQSAGSSADPVFSTATYPATTTINQILYSSSANVVAGLATANNGVLTTGTSGIPVITALASNGQLIIGSGSGAPAAATLTPGTGITITNAANSITIASNGSSMAWTDESVSFNAVSGNGYFVTAVATATLPSAPSQGNVISFIVDTASVLTITANTGQVIRIGTSVSASAGTAASTAIGSSVTLVYRASDTAWIAKDVIGTWTVT